MRQLVIDQTKRVLAGARELRFYVPHLTAVGCAILAGIAMGYAALSVHPSATDAHDRWTVPHWSGYRADSKREMAQNAVWLDQPGKRKAVAEAKKPEVPPWRFIGTVQDGNRRLAVIEIEQGNRVQRVAAGETLPNGAPVVTVSTGELVYSEDNTEKTLVVFARQKDQNFPSGDKKKK